MNRRPKDPKPLFPPGDRPVRVLLVRLSALGDVLNALPVLSSLRAALPAAQIDWVVEDRSRGLLAHREDLDRVIEYPRRALSGALRPLPRPFRLAREVARFLGELRRTSYDAVLDLQGNLKSGAVARAARAGVRYGFSSGASREANHLFSGRRYAPPEGVRHRVDLGMGLASTMLGAPLPYVPPGFPTDDETIAAAARLLAEAGLEPGTYVVLHPGTSGFGAFKRWPAARFGSLAGRLHAEGHAVAVTHGPGEADLAQEVAAAADAPVALLAPTSFGALAEVIRGATLFVGADTGPLHLAALVETSLIGLFGPKDPAVYGPYGERADGVAGVLTTLVQDDVACRPCTLRKCADPLCMLTLAPDAVFRTAQLLHGQ